MHFNLKYFWTTGDSIKVVVRQRSNVQYECERMMGFIIYFFIDLYLNMWLIPSFFRTHIIHWTIVG